MYVDPGLVPDRESRELIEELIASQWKEYMEYVKRWADYHKKDTFKEIAEDPKPMPFNAWTQYNAMTK